LALAVLAALVVALKQPHLVERKVVHLFLVQYQQQVAVGGRVIHTRQVLAALVVEVVMVLRLGLERQAKDLLAG
jgi:hypothetical protein